MIRFGASLCSWTPNSFAAAFYADYILVVKENQGRLHADLKDWFAGCLAENFTQVPHGYPRTVNKGHGRIEIREDESRMRKLNSPENFAMVRQVAYILLKQEQSEKIGIKAKRLKAAGDRDYMIKCFRFEMRLP